jgi:hypothetical protein
MDGINALPEQVAQVAIFALNRTVEWMKGQVSRELSQEKRLKLKLIRDRIAIARANKKNLQLAGKWSATTCSACRRRKDRMNESFAFSDLFRRVANLIRIGKIAEANGAQVKVQIGKVKTNWLPIVSTAGDTNCWIPNTAGEQVAVISPYGKIAQSFVIRSIH